MRVKASHFEIVIDTREQLPYKFFGYPAAAGTLKAGDYSLLGFEADGIAIERKSKSDAYGTIGRGRNRFVRELIRLADFDFAAIVIESSMRDFMIHPNHSELNPNSAINSLIAWQVRYGVHVVFASDRAHAEAWTLRALQKYYREKARST